MGESPGDPEVGPLRRRCIFVDRDGTLNPDLKYLSDWRRLELYRGVTEGIRRLRERGFLVVCVTNQSGIARGFYTEEQVHEIHAQLNRLLERGGASIDRFYYCPHAPSEGCACRKPGTLLFERARDDLGLHLPSSAIIGDRELDIRAGGRLGLRTVLVPAYGHREEVLREARESGATPDLIAPSFRSAADRLLALG